MTSRTDPEEEDPNPKSASKLSINVEVSCAARKVEVSRTEQVLELGAKGTFRNLELDETKTGVTKLFISQPEHLHLDT